MPSYLRNRPGRPRTTSLGRTILDALILAPVAWQTPEELACALDREATELATELVHLELGGWVRSWESRRGGLLMSNHRWYVTLTPWAAEILDVELVPATGIGMIAHDGEGLALADLAGRPETYRWAPRQPGGGRRAHGVRVPSERIPIAEGADPDRVAAAVAHAAPEPDEVTPFPRHLVDRPWYQHPYCGSCHGHVQPDEFCLECGRWDRLAPT